MNLIKVDFRFVVVFVASLWWGEFVVAQLNPTSARDIFLEIKKESKEWGDPSVISDMLRQLSLTTSNRVLIDGALGFPEEIFSMDRYVGRRFFEGGASDNEVDFRNSLTFHFGWESLIEKTKANNLSARKEIHDFLVERAKDAEARQLDLIILGSLRHKQSRETIGETCFSGDEGELLEVSGNKVGRLFCWALLPYLSNDSEWLFLKYQEAIEHPLALVVKLGYEGIGILDISDDRKIATIRNALARKGWPIDDGSAFRMGHYNVEVAKGIGGFYHPALQLNRMTKSNEWLALYPRSSERTVPKNDSAASPIEDTDLTEREFAMRAWILVIGFVVLCLYFIRIIRKSSNIEA